MKSILVAAALLISMFAHADIPPRPGSGRFIPPLKPVYPSRSNAISTQRQDAADRLGPGKFKAGSVRYSQVTGKFKAVWVKKSGGSSTFKAQFRTFR